MHVMFSRGSHTHAILCGVDMVFSQRDVWMSFVVHTIFIPDTLLHQRLACNCMASQFVIHLVYEVQVQYVHPDIQSWLNPLVLAHTNP